MNKIFIGTEKPKPRGACLFIHHTVPRHPLGQVFHPRRHSLDVFRNIDETEAQELAEVFYTIKPGIGATTLTVRNGERALARALLNADRLDLLKTDNDEAMAMRDELLFLPVVRDCLSAKHPIFRLNKHSVILAHLDPKEIGPRAALTLGLILMSVHKGQIIVPDLGRYSRNAHTRLIDENRFIGGIDQLDDLPPHLRRAVLRIKHKVLKGVVYDDAVVLAKQARLHPDPLREDGTPDNRYKEFIEDVMA